MMKSVAGIFGLLLMACALCAQGSLNMVLEANWDDPNLPSSGGLSYNDCWGYNAPNGTEVAIIGTLQRVYFFDVTNPQDPQIIDYFTVLNENGTTNNSIWRDIKTYDHYAYACADQGNPGLLIFDLQYVPDSVVLVSQTREFFLRSHNIWIDVDNARLYTAGANTSGQNTIVLDLGTDPEDPTEIGSPTLPLGYIHDIHVVDHIAYASHGSDQALSIYDFTDADDPNLIKTLEDYPEPGYNHSSWLDASGNRLVFADETHGQSLKLVNPNLEEYQTTNYHLFRSQLLENNSNSIGHNPFIKGDLCFVAYYHDGVQVFDISDTNNITKVAYYDTYVNTGYSGYDGVWGVYPFLSSGNIIASDDANGLFILSLTEGVLPLEFTAFTATPEKQDVQLLWNVTGAHADEVFVVEYSKDGANFETLTEIPSIDNDWRYAYLHADPGPGVHYYRIILRSRDGQLRPSAIRSVELTSAKQFFVRSTIVTDVLTIDVNRGAQITLLGVDGSQLLQRQVDESTRVQLPMNQFPAGQYYVVFRSGTTEEVQTVTKL